MLLSMTGFGEAAFQSDEFTIGVEIRSVNNRHLKITLRANEPYHLLEPEVERVVRQAVKRGTVQVNLRCRRRSSPQDFQLNAVAVRSYLDQLRQIAVAEGIACSVDNLLGQVLLLPGVAPEPGSASLNLEEDWPSIERVLQDGLAKMQTMRHDEGQAMAQELSRYREQIIQRLNLIRERAPQVVELFRDRLLERVRGLLLERDVQIDRSDLIKEVSVFAERSDIAEEIVRLSSHLDQFQEFLNEQESTGRKLEFLTQEMFREANTIGSKASDVEISRQVVEIKGVLEKIRELVQNVE